MPELPKFSFIVPVRNESARIDACLASIKNQDYPADRIEILVPDQSSEDDTRERAARYGARVTLNPAQRAIFSMPRALSEVGGDLITVMAADNRVAPNFCRRMVEAFANPQVRYAFSYVTTDRAGYPLSVRYINRFTDPFNHFIYGNASNPRDLRNVYRPVERKAGYSLYRFSATTPPPLLAIAQGAVLRAPFSMPDGYADDVGVVFDLLKTGALIACVEEALVDHYTASSLLNLLSKFRRIIAKNLRPNSSLRWRDRYLAPQRIARRRLWPLYALSIVAPACVGFYRAVRDREALWLFHPVITFAFAAVATGEALKNLSSTLELLGGKKAAPSTDISRD